MEHIIPAEYQVSSNTIPQIHLGSQKLPDDQHKSKHQNAPHLANPPPGAPRCPYQRFSNAIPVHADHASTLPLTIPTPLHQTNRLQPSTMRPMPQRCQLYCWHPCLVRLSVRVLRDRRDADMVQSFTCDTSPSCECDD
jgi:hypothetical protein